jgi:hypothetical protein
LRDFSVPGTDKGCNQMSIFLRMNHFYLKLFIVIEWNIAKRPTLRSKGGKDARSLAV